jgi:transposase
MSQQRQKYTPEYRREAANLVIESQRPIAHVAKEIGVAPGLLRRWVKNERERLRILGWAQPGGSSC